MAWARGRFPCSWRRLLADVVTVSTEASSSSSFYLQLITRVFDERGKTQTDRFDQGISQMNTIVHITR
jgi:hypothetical protein